LTAAAATDQDAVTITEPHADMPAPTAAPPRTPDDWRDAAQRLLKGGEILVAYDTLVEGLRAFPGDVRLRQLTALALARVGASREANAMLERLLAEGHADEETLGLLARTHKDLWSTATDESERQQHLELAGRYYARAYRATGGYWTGVNAATLALVGGDADDAVALARDVADRCRDLLAHDPQRADRYWVLATLGEAALVAGDIPDAERWYRQASAAAGDRLGDVVSTRRNARLLLRHRGADATLVDACLPVPHVVVFAGHLIDRPDRRTPRFPPDLEPAVRAAIDDRLRRIGPAIGYAAAACGADILFLESVAAASGETRVVLPYNREQFACDSVDIAPRTGWRARFDAALARAAGVIVASEHRLGSGSASFEYGFRVLDGTAAIRADELDTELVCLAVWDGLPGDGPGGTAGSVEHWRRAGRRVDVIDLAAMRTAAGGAEVRLQPDTTDVSPERQRGVRLQQDASAPAAFDPQIVGLLFADAHGFSKLTEAELPIFVERYLGLVAAELARMPTAPLLTNTWGDGLYVVFRDIADTGEFALGLCDAVRETDWGALGIANGLSLRIGLHAGPAYACLDPVTGRLNYIGAHVSRAARIEPITPPGEVYASGAFAALARADQVQAFSCTYVGQTPLAKGYGTFPTYVVRRRA
jgi:class 3 adenylate cyclase/tetratricopeptide (TPR) repeat protein